MLLYSLHFFNNQIFIIRSTAMLFNYLLNQLTEFLFIFLTHIYEYTESLPMRRIEDPVKHLSRKFF